VDGCKRLERYVNDVLTAKSGDYPLAIVQACQRFVDDMGRDDIYFDVDSANKAIGYIELLPHTAGEWQGKPTTLEDFQCFWIGSLFGWKWSHNKRRRFRYAYVQIPRKNGKTHIVVLIALVMLAADGEKGAQVYLGATSRDHCKNILFKPARYIAEHCDDFKQAYGIESGATSLVIPSSNSVLTTVIKSPDDGTSPSCAIVDEYHEHENSDQYDTFNTGMGSRSQPLLHVITTAGGDLGSPCKAEYDDCKRILRGEMEGDTKFILIFEPNDDDDWADEATLAKCNPNMGVSVNREYLLDQLKQAKASAEKQNVFRTKHLNQWVGSKVAWMNMLAWQRQQDKSLRFEDFEGEDCHIGLDLASKKDLAALVAVFKRGDDYYEFPFFFAPESAAELNDRYPQFVNRGEITLTDGNMIDFEFIESKIKEIFKFANVKSVAYDPYQATYLVTRLQPEGINLIEFGHSVKNMSEPMKNLEALVLDGKYHHSGNACMTWQMSNVAAKLDVKDNIYPNKSNRNDERCKIDGVVASIMAMGRWLDEGEASSVYEERGFRTL